MKTPDNGNVHPLHGSTPVANENARGRAIVQLAEGARAAERLAVRLWRPLPVAAPPPRIIARPLPAQWSIPQAPDSTVRGFLQALDPDPMLTPLTVYEAPAR